VVFGKKAVLLMRVAAVIPNWNGASLLRDLLPTIAAQTRPFDDVLVVDNGSTDDSVAFAEQWGAKVLQLGRNRGFAAAVNAGVANSDADAVAILNNDVKLRPDWLTVSASRIADPAFTFVTGKVLSDADPSRIDASFDALCRGACALRCGAGRPDGPYWSRERRVQFAPFTAILIRRAIYQEVGGLDEAFESYLEDVEFGLRCASRRYTGLYEPRAVAMHRGSATLGAWNPTTVRNIARNQVLLVARHYNGPALLRFGWPIAVSQALWGVVALRHGTGAAWIGGKLDGLRKFRLCRGAGHPRMPEILRASERTLQDVQAATGFDWYWRLYLALTWSPRQD
jgi:GT2 family glycosyltransferase